MAETLQPCVKEELKFRYVCIRLLKTEANDGKENSHCEKKPDIKIEGSSHNFTSPSIEENLNKSMSEKVHKENVHLKITKTKNYNCE